MNVHINLKMVDGLDIHINEFKKLSEQDRSAIVFQNIVCIRKNQKDYIVNKKIQYVWLIALTGFLGIKKLFGL